MYMKTHIINFETYNLFLDDFRMPKDCLMYTNEPRYGRKEWVIVRSYDEFVGEVIMRHGEGQFPELVSFDHDLSDEHYDPSMFTGISDYEEVAKQFKEKTGYECAKFFVEFCDKISIELPECLIHSMNPAGRERIKQIIYDYDRTYKKLSHRR